MSEAGADMGRPSEATVPQEQQKKKKPMGPQLPVEIAKTLDDEDFFRLYKEGGLQSRDHLTLSEDNWEEELDKMPLFMTKQPTQEDIDASPDLQAMQALIHAESTPRSRAESAKEDGNQILAAAKKSKSGKKFQNAEYKKAIAAYDAGLAEKCKDAELNAALHANKAAVNLLLGNRRKAINDCTAAIQLNPKHIKSYWRACTANIQLEHYVDAIAFADAGLRADPSNKSLVTERQKAVKLKAAADKKARQKAAQIRKKEKRDAELLAAFQKRQLKFQKPVEVELDVSLKGIAAAGGEVYIDDQGLLHWPVSFLYPEHQQTDFIKDFCEGHALGDHLSLMFNEKEQVPWDAERKYHAGKLSVYFETQPEGNAYKKTKLVRIDPRLTLLETVLDPRYTIVDLTPAFFVLVTGSPFEKQFLEQYDYDGAAVDTKTLES